MQSITEIALEKAKKGFFSRAEASIWINDEEARLSALLKRAVACSEVLRIQRSLYCLNPKYLNRPINPLVIAQRIHGPSYISLEMALSYHGLIPEAVYTITSVSVERSREFDTPFGCFSFSRVPQREFFSGVRSIESDEGERFLIAVPLKAIADYVYVHRLNWVSIHPVVESLRVDSEYFLDLTLDEFNEVESAYRSGRVLTFLRGCKRELKL